MGQMKNLVVEAEEYGFARKGKTFTLNNSDDLKRYTIRLYEDGAVTWTLYKFGNNSSKRGWAGATNSIGEAVDRINTLISDQALGETFDPNVVRPDTKKDWDANL